MLEDIELTFKDIYSDMYAGGRRNLSAQGIFSAEVDVEFLDDGFVRFRHDMRRRIEETSHHRRVKMTEKVAPTERHRYLSNGVDMAAGSTAENVA